MDYDDDGTLTAYIWNYYQHLMTDFERLVGKAIIGRAKAEHSSSPKMTAMLQQGWGRVDDPAINAALQNGTEAFRRQVRDRLLQNLQRADVHQSLPRMPPDRANAQSAAVYLVWAYLVRTRIVVRTPMKQKLRKITVDGVVYLWRFVPGYEQTPPGEESDQATWQSRDTFTAYLATQRASPLIVRFRTWEDPIIGGPLRVGAPINLNNPESSGINLHTPLFAAAIIRHMRQRGWQPEQTTTPFIIEDGLQLLADMGYTVE